MNSLIFLNNLHFPALTNISWKYYVLGGMVLCSLPPYSVLEIVLYVSLSSIKSSTSLHQLFFNAKDSDLSKEWEIGDFYNAIYYLSSSFFHIAVRKQTYLTTFFHTGWSGLLSLQFSFCAVKTAQRHFAHPVELCHQNVVQLQFKHSREFVSDHLLPADLTSCVIVLSSLVKPLSVRLHSRSLSSSSMVVDETSLDYSSISSLITSSQVDISTS